MGSRVKRSCADCVILFTVVHSNVTYRPAINQMWCDNKHFCVPQPPHTWYLITGWSGLHHIWDQTSESYRGPVALRKFGVIGSGVIALVVSGLCHRRVPEQKGVLVAATAVFVGGPGWRHWWQRRAPGGLVVGRGRTGSHSWHGCNRGPRPREEEGSVVGVLVQVGVGPPGLRRLGRRVWICADGHLC